MPDVRLLGHMETQAKGNHARVTDRPAYMDKPLLMGPDPNPDSDVAGMARWGWMSSWELSWLRETAETMDSCCEVGSLRGRSATALLTGCSGPVYCIDPWEDPGDHCYTGFIEALGHFPNLHPVRGYSPAVADQVPEVDFTFIDAQHDYESCKADIDAFLPKTRKMIAGHDYSDPADYTEQSSGYAGVYEAVVETFGLDAVNLAPGTSIWFVNL